MATIQYEFRTYVFGLKKENEVAGSRTVFIAPSPNEPDKADDAFVAELDKMGAEGWVAFHIARAKDYLTVTFRRSDDPFGEGQ